MGTILAQELKPFIFDKNITKYNNGYQLCKILPYIFINATSLKPVEIFMSIVISHNQLVTV